MRHLLFADWMHAKAKIYLFVDRIIEKYADILHILVEKEKLLN